jgi:hypothetical protein
MLAGSDTSHALSLPTLSLLIGLCSIPLQLCMHESEKTVLARGQHVLPNVLEGWDGAVLDVQVSVTSDATEILEDAIPSCTHALDAPAVHVPYGAVSQQEPAEPLQTGRIPPEGPEQLAILHHAFEMHMLSMSNLVAPQGNSSDKATMPMPAARYLKYVSDQAHVRRGDWESCMTVCCPQDTYHM